MHGDKWDQAMAAYHDRMIKGLIESEPPKQMD